MLTGKCPGEVDRSERGVEGKRQSFFVSYLKGTMLKSIIIEKVYPLIIFLEVFWIKGFESYSQRFHCRNQIVNPFCVLHFYSFSQRINNFREFVAIAVIQRRPALGNKTSPIYFIRYAIFTHRNCQIGRGHHSREEQLITLVHCLFRYRTTIFFDLDFGRSFQFPSLFTVS